MDETPAWPRTLRSAGGTRARLHLLRLGIRPAPPHRQVESGDGQGPPLGRQDILRADAALEFPGRRRALSLQYRRPRGVAAREGRRREGCRGADHCANGSRNRPAPRGNRAVPRLEESAGESGGCEELVAREKAEWEAASLVVCGSEYVRDGIRSVGGPWHKCVVVPYGVGRGGERPGTVRESPRARRLRVLFVGGVGLRKGIQYLAKAASLLSDTEFEFRAVGGIGLAEQGRRAVSKYIQLRGPVPRSEVSAEFAWADVFVFPSLCEGSATVCYEALRSGLPVIATPNAGSVVRDGVDGFIVPVRDPQAIARKLIRMVDEPGLLERMSRSALERASEFTVEKYGARLIEALNE
ncbi:MAG: glycosyltransferase family 4 protein [Paludibaculum sp.]